jgi:type III secretion system FlhB-like substrate exporter
MLDKVKEIMTRYVDLDPSEIHEDSKLADTLSNLEIGEMIPPELYETVAQVLAGVYRAKGLVS